MSNEEAQAAGKPEYYIDWIRLAMGVAIVALLAVCMAQYTKLNAGPPPPPLASTDTSTEQKPYAIVNAHEHLYKEEHLENYLKAAERMGITKTLFVASSQYTFLGRGHESETNLGNDWSTQEILKCAKKYPGKIIPFATLHPDDPDKVALLEGCRSQGCQGLKLYTGHGNFHDRPLDVPEMDPVYAWCQENSFPICWHVNLTRYADEITKVMLNYPKLKLIIPHIGQAYYNPAGKEMEAMERLLDLYPGIYTDMSFGTRDILVAGLDQVSRNREAFRAFYEKYQDRIMWGTDMVVTGNSEKTPEWIESILRAARDFQEKDTYVFWMAATGSPYARKGSDNPYGVLRGLALPDEILKKVYETNFENFMALKL